MKRLGALKLGALFILISLTTAKVIRYWNGSPDLFRFTPIPLTKQRIAAALQEPTSFYRFPTEIQLPMERGGGDVKAVVEYSFDSKLQEAMEKEFRQYGPDYGAFVALDASTGRVLAMVSFTRDPGTHENLALRATFPSASVFKMVTAAAAIEEEKLSPNTVIPYNGRNHTLYKGNVLHTQLTRWTRYITLKEAFAKSINTVFGKIGSQTLKPEELRAYAGRFGFDRQLMSDVLIQEGHAPISNDPWKIAETASGYTRDNTMSPLQGAMMAAAIVNDGVMMEPFVVHSVYKTDGTSLYTAEPKVSAQAVDSQTASELRELMKETILDGTSRKVFRGFARTKLSFLDVGGKTGSLNGLNPVGKYDWFVGYASGRGKKIAVAAVTIHKTLWRVKSSYLARRGIESYFTNFIKESELAAAPATGTSGPAPAAQ